MIVKSDTHTEGGSVTFAQRFGSALNLNPHFHARIPRETPQCTNVSSSASTAQNSIIAGQIFDLYPPRTDDLVDDLP